MIYELQLRRARNDRDATLGILYDGSELLCYTLEDQAQEGAKVPGETRIPEGLYRVVLRTEGGFHSRYSARFPDIHRGMLWLRDVPGFEYILIHCGNTDQDTAGCILVGDRPNAANAGRAQVYESTNAYRRIYSHIWERLRVADATVLRVMDLR